MKKVLLQKIESYMEKYHMIEAGGHIIVGVSGGADSVCLLLVLLELREKMGFTISVAHVEHGIRGTDSRKDAAFVQQLCDKKSIDCTIYARQAPEYAAAHKLSLEEAGRYLRYEAFAEEKNKYQWYLQRNGKGLVRIAVAHHLEDNGETMLFHLVRGTRLLGLAGIAPIRGDIIRPLLTISRQEIEAYLETEKQAFCIDSSNSEDIYIRNRLRHQVMPVLEQVNPLVQVHMYQTGEYIRQVEDYLSRQAKKAREACCRFNGPDSVEIVQKDFFEIEELLRGKLLYQLLGEFAGSYQDITKDHVYAMQELFEKQTGKKRNLPYGILAVRTYSGVELRRNRPTLDMSGEMKPDGQEKEAFSWRIIEKKETITEFSKKKYTKCFDYDKIESNFCIRHRLPGDFLEVTVDGARQKLKKYLINEKIPAEERDRLLLLADGSHIMWIVGYRISSYYKVRESTRKILEVTFYGGKEDE